MTSADPNSELPDDASNAAPADSGEPAVQGPRPGTPEESPQSEAEPVEATLAGSSPLPATLGEPSTVKGTLPQPNFLVAAALTTLPIFAQMVGGFLVFLVALVVVMFIAGPQAVMGFMTDSQVYLFPVGTMITLLVALAVSWLFFRNSLGRKIAWRGISVGQLLCVLALTGPLAVLASEVTNCVGDLMPHVEFDFLKSLRESSGELFMQFVAMPWWFVFISGCLLPGLGEEIYCRGLLSRGLVARYGVVGGTLLTAGLFGAMHIEPVQAIGAFALGVGMQFVFLTTRSLSAPILLHIWNNSFAFLTMRCAETFPIPGVTPSPDGGVEHTHLTVLAAAAAAAAVLAVIMYQNRTCWELPDGSDWDPGYVTAEMPDGRLGAVAVRGPVQPLLVLGAVIAIGLFVAAVVASNQSVAV